MKIIASCLTLITFSFSVLAADLPPDDPVLVKWRNLSLSRQDFRAALQAVPEKDRAEFSSDMKRVTAMLENILVIRTLSQEAKELGLDKDPLIQKEAELAVQRLLAQRRMAWFEKQIKKPDFTAAALERYKTKAEEFEIPAQIGVSHALVDLKGRSNEEARKRADEVRAKALAGADFADLAKEYSDDPSKAKNGGDLGLFSKGKMVKPFEEAAYALINPGDISEVVQTKFGYHVIRLNSRVPARKKSFDEVKAALIKDLEDKFVAGEVATYLSKIKNDKSIVMETAEIDKLVKP